MKLLSSIALLAHLGTLARCLPVEGEGGSLSHLVHSLQDGAASSAGSSPSRGQQGRPHLFDLNLPPPPETALLLEEHADTSLSAGYHPSAGESSEPAKSIYTPGELRQLPTPTPAARGPADARRQAEFALRYRLALSKTHDPISASDHDEAVKEVWKRSWRSVTRMEQTRGHDWTSVSLHDLAESRKQKRLKRKAFDERYYDKVRKGTKPLTPQAPQAKPSVLEGADEDLLPLDHLRRQEPPNMGFAYADHDPAHLERYRSQYKVAVQATPGESITRATYKSALTQLWQLSRRVSGQAATRRGTPLGLVEHAEWADRLRKQRQARDEAGKARRLSGAPPP